MIQYHVKISSVLQLGILVGTFDSNLLDIAYIEFGFHPQTKTPKLNESTCKINSNSSIAFVISNIKC